METRKKARLTEAGAYRLGTPHLAGRVVEYDKLVPPCDCADWIYYQGERVGGILSTTGGDKALILLPDVES